MKQSTQDILIDQEFRAGSSYDTRLDKSWHNDKYGGGYSGNTSSYPPIKRNDIMSKDLNGLYIFEEKYKNGITVEQYLQEVKRTYNPKFWDDSICSKDMQRILDNVHCVMGMVDEMNEFEDVYILSDYNQNLQEVILELGDIYWYVANYCNFNSIEFKNQQDILIDFGDPLKTRSGYFGEFEQLLAIHKKELAYFKPVDITETARLIHSAIQYLYDQAKQLGSTPEDIMYFNLKKLYVRYPESFVADLAINKDEKKELENIINKFE